MDPWLSVPGLLLVWLFEGNPAIHPPTSGPVAFRPTVTRGLVLRQPGYPAFKSGPVAFRPRITPGLARPVVPLPYVRLDGR